jgi:hypothetical protein
MDQQMVGLKLVKQEPPLRKLMQERSEHPTNKPANGHTEPRDCQCDSYEDAITASAINWPSWIFHGLKTESSNQIADQ